MLKYCFWILALGLFWQCASVSHVKLVKVPALSLSSLRVKYSSSPKEPWSQPNTFLLDWKPLQQCIHSLQETAIQKGPFTVDYVYKDKQFVLSHTNCLANTLPRISVPQQGIALAPLNLWNVADGYQCVTFSFEDAVGAHQKLSISFPLSQEPDTERQIQHLVLTWQLSPYYHVFHEELDGLLVPDRLCHDILSYSPAVLLQDWWPDQSHNFGS